MQIVSKQLYSIKIKKLENEEIIYALLKIRNKFLIGTIFIILAADQNIFKLQLNN